MKVVLQRVSQAGVNLKGDIPNPNEFIAHGFVLFVCFCKGDTEEVLYKMCNKIINLRVFPGFEGKMSFCIKDLFNSMILSIPQFTLCADVSNGNRPSFDEALDPKTAKVLYDKFNDILSNECEIEVQTGMFGSDMEVFVMNDGPVTIILDTDNF